MECEICVPLVKQYILVKSRGVIYDETVRTPGTSLLLFEAGVVVLEDGIATELGNAGWMRCVKTFPEMRM